MPCSLSYPSRTYTTSPPPSLSPATDLHEAHELCPLLLLPGGRPLPMLLLRIATREAAKL